MRAISVVYEGYSCGFYGRLTIVTIELWIKDTVAVGVSRM